jgi:DNA-directed RNA polymerase subunit M/transcription elongation factor TFIIS
VERILERKGREPREKNPQIYDRKSIPERSKLLKEAHEICPNCFRKVEGDVIPRHIFCTYCGAKLKIRLILKEKGANILKNSESQNFETQKLSFCNKCGALMFPVKVKDILVMKCKCGVTKPFNENITNAYKIKKKIEHSFNEENIYRCICNKKFSSPEEFSNHSTTCKKAKELNIKSNRKITNYLKKKKAEEEKALIKKRAKKFFQTMEKQGVLLNLGGMGVGYLKPFFKAKCFNCGNEAVIKNYFKDKVQDEIATIEFYCAECKMRTEI